ncbi:DUN1_1 [Sanghuangporus weigelae]
MLKFFRVEENRKALIAAYNELLNEREDSIGFTVEDPITSKNPVETAHQMQRIRTQYIELQSCIGKKRLSVSSFIGKGRDKVVASLIADVKLFKKEYEKRTLSRSAYGILAPLAFSAREKLPIIMGKPNSEDVFSVTWSIQFQQLSAESPSIGLLENMGVNREDVIWWWFEENSEYANEVTDVWDDINRMALRLVYIFDETVKRRFPGEFVTTVQSLRWRITRLGTTLARLVFLRHNRTADILPLFEVFIPTIFGFSTLVRSVKDIESKKKEAHFLDVYISSLESDCNELLSRLNAVKEMEKYSKDDLKTCHRPALLQRVKEQGISASSREEIVSSLKSLGLTEIDTDPELGKELGRGSFAQVHLCSAPDASATYAVKFFKKKSGPDRTKQRIIREAERWHGLSHTNINALLGFTTHPNLSLPGLVTKVHGQTLHDYVHTEYASISEMDRLVLLFQIAEALRYLHDEKGLAHGDLRPANVVMESRLTVKVIDFGVAYVEDSLVQTTTNQKTNEAFLAPELKKKSEGLRQVSQKGDIYAFGCCFLDVFYVVDVEDDTVGKLKKSATRSSKVPPFSVIDRDIKLEHWKFLLNTWDGKPDRRPTARELIDIIHKFMN